MAQTDHSPRRGPLRVVQQGADFKIIIMDAPRDDEAAARYVDQLKGEEVTDVVRTCEKTYEPGPFEKEGIRVHDMSFSDGAAPPAEVLEKWCALVLKRYGPRDKGRSTQDGPGIIAVHCVAGLGRAPVMAAIALMEMTHMGPLDAVEKIREIQRGAINKNQLEFLQAYKPQNKKPLAVPCGPCCIQ